MVLRTARPFASRIRHAIAFVAIVWFVAATFVAFEVFSESAVDLVRAFPGLFGDVMLSPTVTESTSCAPPSGSERAKPPSTIGQTDAGVASWQLGVNLGRDAAFRQFAGSNRQVLDGLAQARHNLAARLSVAPPEPFTPEHIVNANIEFVAFVEQGGATETSQQLAARHSPRACEVFKFGAFWGYSEMVRPLLPGDRTVFEMEIRHHAMRADVPPLLWNPMLEPTPADAARDDIIAATQKLTDDVTTYLTRLDAGEPPPQDPPVAR
jgi:hypothetical protein